jgi:mono/diheme cytochrome c family protein
VTRTDSPAEDALTEIPEHLLKRAQQRRAALSGGGGDDAAADAPAGDAPAAAADAPAAAVTPAKKGPAPLPTLDDDAPAAKPDIPVVAAYKRRKRVPFFGAAVLALLPVWAFLYYFAVKPPPAGANDPIAIGKTVYSEKCAGCHQADGSGIKTGGVGQQLTEGHVLKTFADPLDMAHWVAYGADGARANGTYGDKSRPGGAMQLLPTKMPGFGKTLTPEEIAAVVIYIRQDLSNGGKPLAQDDPNVNVDTFTADPEAIAAMVKAEIDLGPGGDPKTTTVDGSEKKSK